MNARRISFPALAALALALGAAACGGRGSAGTCPGYGACAGDPSGDWKLGDACQNLAIKPYQPLSLPDQLKQPQDPTLEPPQPTPTTSGNWCSDLIYQPGDANSSIKGVTLYHGPLDIKAGTLHHYPNMSYAAAIIFGADEHVFFPGACIDVYGAPPPPDAGAADGGASDAGPPPDRCETLAVGLNQYFKTYPSFQRFTCQSRGGGCACDYVYELVAADVGIWEIDPASPSTIIHHSKKGSEPARATFCATGGTLEMTGADGTGMFGQQGLRSLSYVKM